MKQVISWNEIKNRSITFAKEWQDETSEDAEAKSFWDGFFDVFGVPRKRVASFEQARCWAGGSRWKSFEFADCAR